MGYRPQIAAIIPTKSGQIGINPPPPESMFVQVNFPRLVATYYSAMLTVSVDSKGHIGKNTKYLTDLGTSTKVSPVSLQH